MRLIYKACGVAVVLGMLSTSVGRVVAAPTEIIRVARNDAPGSADGDFATVISQHPSDRDKLRFTEEAVEEMKDGLDNIQRLIDEARRAKDMGLLNCLNEKYSVVNALLKIAETAAVLLKEAIVENDTQDIDHQFRKVVLARFKARIALSESANACSAGSDDPASGSDGDVQIITDIAVDIDPVVGTEPEEDIGGVIEVPPPPSP